MKVGTLCYATDQGLSILAKSFYDHGIITDVLVVKHSHRESHKEWYPTSQEVPIRQLNRDLTRLFCLSVDVMFFFETPFDWSLLEYCRENKIKTVLMPMYECMPVKHPQPDFYINPSLLDQRYYPERSTFMPVPVEVKWRQRTKARVFVHNSGFGGLRGRNGTYELLQAIRLVKSDAKFLIRCQHKSISFPPYPELLGRATLIQESVPYAELFKEGDVFIFPEKFNGLSLPLQEARAAGMLVMSTNRFPMNTWLPVEPLIPAIGTVKERISPRCHTYDESVISAKDIAATIDSWFDRDITMYSRSGRDWAEAMSWDTLKPKYLEVLNSL